VSIQKPINIKCNDLTNCESIPGSPITKILVPFDDSEHAARAFGFALTLAKNFGASVSVISIVQEEIKNSWISGTPGREKGMTERSSSRLENRAGSLQLQAEKFDVRFESAVVTSNSIAETLLTIIRQYKIDFVVMGSRGKGMHKEMMLGRISTHVALNSNCPVLLVK
jgi:nucleotide-binding universal stress UspA family protein